MTSQIARRLRKNMTEAEQRLWSRLRGKQIDGLHFRRQTPIGKYVADFYCHAARLIIEVDGGQHEIDAEQDAIRTRELENSGFHVIRFWNNDVFENIDGILEQIRDAASHP